MRTSILVLASLLSACAAQPSSEIRSSKARLTPTPPAADLAELVAGNTALALDLYRAAAPRDANFIFAPYGVSIEFAMAYAGARGDTESRIAGVFHFTLPAGRLHPAFDALDLSLSSASSQLHIGNRLFVQSAGTYGQPYLDTLAQYYGAGLDEVDFQSPAGWAEIDGWVSSQLGQTAPPNPYAGDGATHLDLVDVVKLDAAWKTAFDAAQTSAAPFLAAAGSTVQVPTMSLTAELRMAQVAGATAVELPYDGDRLVMLALLPDADLASFTASLTPAGLADIASALTARQVHVTMPRFSFQTQLDIGGALPALMLAATDFSGMGSWGPLHTQAAHTAFVEVSERGTVAGGVTQLGSYPGAVMQPTLVALDRPFLFVVRDTQSGAVLFLGHVANPS